MKQPAAPDQRIVSSKVESVEETRVMRIKSLVAGFFGLVSVAATSITPASAFGDRPDQPSR